MPLNTDDIVKVQVLHSFYAIHLLSTSGQSKGKAVAQDFGDGVDGGRIVNSNLWTKY